MKQGAQSKRSGTTSGTGLVTSVPAQTQGRMTSEFQGPLEEVSNRSSVRKGLEVRCLIYISAPIHINSQAPLSNYQGLILGLQERGEGGSQAQGNKGLLGSDPNQTALWSSALPAYKTLDITLKRLKRYDRHLV